MPLQSSGQITLAEVRNEFFGNTGTTQFAMSGLYNKGNAPGSGEIQLAADFYGTANYLASGTVNVGYGTVKTSNDESGYSNGSQNGGRAFGSISSGAIQGTNITIVSIFESPAVVQKFRLVFSAGYTGWTKLTVNGNVVFLRANVTSGGGSNPTNEWATGSGLTTTPTSFILE